MAKVEIFTDPHGKQWKIITLPDGSGGETVLVIEQ